MKKLSLLMAALLVVSFALIGCGTKNKEEAESSAGEKLKVVLLIPGNLGDKSFFDAANRGLNLVKEELNAETKVIEMGTDSTKWEPNLLDAIEGDWDLIITGSSITELLNEMAPNYTDKKFINFDTNIKETPENVYAMFYSSNEGSFLAGAAAALVTSSDIEFANEDKKIGFLGGMDIPGINDFLIGYIEGAQYVDKDTKVAISYAGDFGDPAKGKELTLAQFNSGVDISFNVAGGTGLGVIDAAKEKDKYAIGVDADQAMTFKETDEEKSNHIVTSALKRIDNSILRAVKMYQEGSLKFGVHEEMGVKEGGVGLAKNEYYERILPQEIKDKLEQIEADLVSGKIEVTSAFGLSSEEINKIRESVKPN
ncbi:BMP family ABC transporter substrate-binding protein [Clostridium sediminicola]|uniref:BMP family ABC transporter substrate-binding protein n=1 Tax=Clostridium sediminicola TaxID=3114879 RepID=UPI0031F1FCD6